MDVVAFQQKWIGASNQKEKSASQSHFNDLCDLLGVPKPLDADHVGDTYAFEKGAGIIGGGDGWADVWYKGHFAWEYKGRGKDLDAAYKQLLGYKDDLQNPPLMIVSDLNIIRIHTNFTNKVKMVYEYDLNGLNQPGVLSRLKKVWTDPDSFEPGTTILASPKTPPPASARSPSASTRAARTPLPPPTSSCRWSSASSPRTSASCQTASSPR